MRTLLALVLLSAPSAGFAAGETAAELLRLGAGPAVALGEASAATLDGPASLLYNPAGLGGLLQAEVYGAHEQLPESLRSNVLLAAVPLKGATSGVLAYGLRLLSQDPLDKLDRTGAARGTFSASDMAHTLGWGTVFGRDRLGVSVTYVRQTIDGSSGSALALGAGVQRRFRKFDAGASISNAGSELKLGTETAALPLTVRGGVRWVSSPTLQLAVDASDARGRSARLHVGAAFAATPAAELRAGWALGGAQKDGPLGLALGAGLRFGAFKVDLAWRPFGELGSAVQLGLGWRFK